MKKITNYLKMLLVLLSISSAVKAQNCIANFTWTYGANGAVTFTSTSVLVSTVNPTSYYWSFGNGNTYTATGFPGMTANTTYTANGTYTVSLFIMSIPTCSAGIQLTLNITNANGGCALNSNFNYSQGANGLVNFNNITTGTVSGTTYAWSFGSNNATSTSMFPNYTYSANGAYVATLVATNNATCVSTKTLLINVNSYCTLAANFTATNGNNGLVNFLSTSTGTASGWLYNWKFGDGGQVTTGPSTSHIYQNGTYNATLTVMNNSLSPTCMDTMVKVVTVTNNTCNLTANFSFSVGASGAVSFVNTSTGTTGSSTYNYNFGNGFTSTQASPSTTYPSGGVYYVSLAVSNASNCVSYITKSVNVNTMPCVANANFSLVPTFTAQYWQAIPAFPWNVAAASWSWGDNTVSTGSLYASHQYSASGMYNICLTVTASCGATASACTSYSVFRPASPAQIINVNCVAPPLKDADDNNNVGINTIKGDPISAELYPNPNSGLFNVTVTNLQAATATIAVYNLVGELVFTKEMATENGAIVTDISLNNATQGVYFVKVIAGEKSTTQKLVIQK